MCGPGEEEDQIIEAFHWLQSKDGCITARREISKSDLKCVMPDDELRAIAMEKFIKRIHTKGAYKEFSAPKILTTTMQNILVDVWRAKSVQAETTYVDGFDYEADDLSSMSNAIEFAKLGMNAALRNIIETSAEPTWVRAAALNLVALDSADILIPKEISIDGIGQGARPDQRKMSIALWFAGKLYWPDEGKKRGPEAIRTARSRDGIRVRKFVEHAKNLRAFDPDGPDEDGSDE